MRTGLGNAAPPGPPRSPPEPPGAARPAPAPAPRSCCGAIVPPRGRRRAERQPRHCSAAPWLLAGWGESGLLLLTLRVETKENSKWKKKFEEVFLIPIITVCKQKDPERPEFASYQMQVFYSKSLLSDKSKDS